MGDSDCAFGLQKERARRQMAMILHEVYFW